MGAPLAATALARSRTVRRVILGILAATALITATMLLPLVTIPFALAATGVKDVPMPPTGPGPVAVGTWGYPYDGPYWWGRGFGHNPVDGCSFCSTNHAGTDISQGCGSLIYAAGPGRVITAGSFYGYGNTVRIDHGDGLVSLYGHMQWQSIVVREGQDVAAGTPLGAEGNTGNSFGCHLHFEFTVNDRAIDPEPFMAARGLPLR